MARGHRPTRRTSSRSCLRSRAPSTGARGSAPEARCGSRIESVGPPRSAPRTHAASVPRSPSSRPCSIRRRGSTRCSPAATCSPSATARWPRWSSRCSSTARCARTRCSRRSRPGWPTPWRVKTPTIRTSASSTTARTTARSTCPRCTSAVGTTSTSTARSRTSSACRPHAATDEARRAQRLVVGPWPHWTPQISVVGDVDFGPNAVLDLEPLRREWFGHWLQDQPAPMLDDAPIRIFVMGENVWRDEWEWPLARTEWTSWYLHSGGHANTSDGDGVLGLDAPGRRRARPTRSTTTRATRCRRVAAGCSASGERSPGAFDQRDVETRRRRARVHDTTARTSRGDHRTRCASSCGRPPRRPTPTSPRSSSRCTPTAAPSTSATESCARVAFVPTPLAAGAAYRFTIELWEISALDRRGQPPAARDLVEQLPALRAQLQLRQAGRHRHRRRHPHRPPDRLPRRGPPEPAHPAR